MSIPAIVFVGPPGAGKGTQADLLAREFSNVYHVSSGDLLRSQKDSALARTYASTLARGDYFPDDVAMHLIKQALDAKQLSSQDLVLMDGTPRTVPQVLLLTTVLDVRAVVFLDVKDEAVLVARMSSRGERPYDNSADAPLRIDTYNSLTAPVIDEYRRIGVPVISINATRSIDSVRQELFKALKLLPSLAHWL